MTTINLKDNIIVDRIIPPKRPKRHYETEVWISLKAREESKKLLTDDLMMDFRDKLVTFAKAGFAQYEGDEPTPIQYEGNGVYRIAPSARKSLFRLVGFYNSGKSEFIIIDAFMKHGQRNRPSEREIYDRVAKVRKDGSWKKRKQ